jgi:endonuclease III related protein
MRSSTFDKLKAFHAAMLAHYGAQDWWPGESRDEIIIGAILTQNTAWRNVEKAIDNLRRAEAIDWARLRDMAAASLAELIKPAGYFNVKARRLKSFVTWLWERYDADLDRMFATSLPTLREELLSVSGIGRETADDILLYAGDLPTFVVDAYTARIMCRHGLIDREAGYEEIKELFESNLPTDVPLYNEYHALIVQVGKNHCRPRARCEGCPLECFPHEVEESE